MTAEVMINRRPHQERAGSRVGGSRSASPSAPSPTPAWDRRRLVEWVPRFLGSHPPVVPFPPLFVSPDIQFSSTAEKLPEQISQHLIRSLSNL